MRDSGSKKSRNSQRCKSQKKGGGLEVRIYSYSPYKGENLGIHENGYGLYIVLLPYGGFVCKRCGRISELYANNHLQTLGFRFERDNAP